MVTRDHGVVSIKSKKHICVSVEKEKSQMEIVVAQLSKQKSSWILNDVIRMYLCHNHRLAIIRC